MTGNDQIESQTGFICEASGSSGLVGVFEDDGDTGYLYVYDPNGRGVLTHLHVYDRRPELLVRKVDVRVVWSSDWQKCGVIILDKFRGIINIATGEEGRVWMEKTNSPGIADKKLLRGFTWGTSM
jgi:hypothetical protein